MATRSRKENNTYKKYRNSDTDFKNGCVFCSYTNDSPSFVSETKSFKIIRNIFPYSVWDSQKVADHLMVVPKLHTDTLSDLKSHEAIEFVEIIASYESQGYNVYARAPKSKMKSVVHQHTHLIKPADAKTKLLLYIRKPYIRITG